MVEFAIVFPLLVILIIGIFEVGRVMFTYSVAIAATREAARYGAAIQDIGGGIPQYEDCQGIRNAATRFGKFAGIADADITIQYSDDTGIYSTSCPPSQEVGLTDSITVTINSSISPITPMGSFTSIPVTSSSSRTILRKIRLGETGTGVGSVTGLITDVNFKTTMQTAEETKGTIVAEVELNQVATDLVTIPFSVTGTAVEGVDYTITSSPVFISPGFTSTTIYITLINDAIEEGDEALFIGINTPTNATKGPQDIHMVTIVDPPLVSFSLADCIKLESETITGLNVVLSKASTQDVTVPIVSGGTATWGLGADYHTSPSSVVIPAGSISSFLNVTINDDLIDEDDEFAALGLGAPTNAVLGSVPMHLMTIVDNDSPTEVMFFTADQVVSEEIGTFTTQVTLSSVSSKTVQVPYTISGTTIPADYIIHYPSPLTFPPGTKVVDINMSILEGDGWEVDETLILTLGTPTNASLGSPSEQTIVITEASAMPSVSFASSTQSITEGNKTIDVYLQMSNAWSSDVVIQLNVSGTASNGSGQDYLLGSNSLVIPVGYTQGAVQIEIYDDALFEETEQIILSLGAIANGTAAAPSTHTIAIVDNDTASEVDFAISQVEKVESAGLFSVTVLLNTPATQNVSVPLVLSGTAAQGADYSLSASALTIPAGAISASFDITIIDDSQFEPEETIVVDLGSPTNAVLGSDTRYTVRIEDDELPLCDVGTHMLTVGADSLNWSITNKGEELIYKGGSVNWTDAGGNKPRLIEIRFSGSVVFTGDEKPSSFYYSATETFAELDTTSVVLSFDDNLGIGPHVLVGNFVNASNGTSCSLTEAFQTH
jgi:Flp pilus assembly protein TadG